MQGTLLSLAIALILALVTALVGPIFVDWGRFRPQFESTASRLTGMQIRVAGTIDARILPTPSLILRQLEIALPGDAGTLRARSLAVEFALGSLVRGELRAADVRLEGADLAVALDPSGRFGWRALAVGIDPDAVSVQRLNIEDSRALLIDPASGSRLALDKVEFKGEMRSLVGPLRGEGSFVVAGQHYPYRIGTARPADDGAVRIRLNLDPIDRPLTVDVDAFVWVDGGTPRFEGTLNMARPVTRAPRGAQTLITEPWRVTSRVRGDSKSAVLEQVEFQYGPDDRAIKLKGDAKLMFGGHPRLEGVLSSTQIDLDRLVALPDASRRRPLLAIKTFADNFAGGQRPPIPVRLGLSVESVTLGGSVLQRVSGDVTSDGENWDVESVDFRAPGLTQVRLSGRLGMTASGIGFAGPAKIEARDPRTLVGWLTDRSEAQSLPGGPLRIEGDIKLGSDMIAVERLKAELDRMTIEGRLGYSWAAEQRPARIEAALTAPEIDFDRVSALTQGLLGDTVFEWPREGSLALKVGKALVAGVEAKGADVNMQFDPQGLQIERLAAADFGGAAFAVKGRIDTRASSPRGSVTLDLDARSLDGVTSLLEKIAPRAADQLRRSATRFVPAKLQATVSVDPQIASGPAGAAFKLDGKAGTFQVSLQGNAGAAGNAWKLDDISAGKLDLTGRFDAADGGALVGLVGLERLVAVDRTPGRLDIEAKGALDGDLAVSGKLVAGGLNASAAGTARLSGDQGPTALLDVKLANANLRSPRPAASGRAGDAAPAELTAKVALGGGIASLTDLAGKVAGSDVKGRLTLGLSEPTSIDGEIELGAVDLPVAFAAAIGVTQQPRSGSGSWSAEPFEPAFLGALSGQVAVRSARVALTPKLVAEGVRGIVHFDPTEVALEGVNGHMTGGRVSGDLTFQRGADGLTARGDIGFAGTDIAELIPGDGRPPLAGRLTLDLQIEGTGRSPQALIGSLKGSGRFTLQDGKLSRLDPGAFFAVIRSVDLGLPVDAVRIRDRTETALSNGPLTLQQAEGSVSITAGQMRLANVAIRAQGADLAVSGSYDLGASVLDARLTLTGPGGAGAPGGKRPEVVVSLKGPVDAPRRALDVTAFSSWLALRALDRQSRQLDQLEGRPGPSGSQPAPGGTPPQRPARTAPSVQQAPPLPPPTDIRPAPRPSPPRSEGGAVRTEGVMR